MSKKYKKSAFFNNNIPDDIDTSEIEYNPDSDDYVNNDELYKSVCKWKEDYTNNGCKPTKIPDDIGLAMMEVSRNLIRRHNFSMYTQDWKEEMIQEGIEACVRNLKNFDENRYKNVFIYFSMACWCAFVQQMKKEKKNNVIKYAYFIDNVQEEYIPQMENQTDEDFIQDIHNKVNDFDSTVERGKKKKRNNKQQTEEVEQNPFEFLDEL